ncbi:hypothetical protein GCM10018781_40010 [Kitasatospora indigofera]|uniref:Uncharacterized protein n=1 Tax=Kitasatospora indigofera TaxID=67307 RepID=A0A919FY87_9ACTN|nr:hypothetical protein GCM10018781_40010 [Kitasatospora indigofera]
MRDEDDTYGSGHVPSLGPRAGSRRGRHAGSVRRGRSRLTDRTRAASSTAPAAIPAIRAALA